MTLEERVAALERTVAELVATPPAPQSVAPTPTAEPPPPGEYWILDGLRERHADGAVSYAGLVPLPTGGEVTWQYGATSVDIEGIDWSELAGAFDALGSPVRLKILQLVYAGVHGSAALAAHEELGSTGQIHHHLRALVAAGWLAHKARGEYEIPARRIVPLLTCVLAAKPT